jgi:hypothetical protein
MGRLGGSTNRKPIDPKVRQYAKNLDKMHKCGQKLAMRALKRSGNKLAKAEELILLSRK